MTNDATLRDAAMREYQRCWQDATELGTDLSRVFDRLAASQEVLAEHGTHTTVVFKNVLVQAWWVAYQEAHGAMLPRQLLEVPLPEPASLKAMP